MLLDGRLAAVLLISGVSSFLVPPPANVTVSCQNLKTTVHWDYSRGQPQTSFKVKIETSNGKSHEGYTSDHLYDLSDFVWQSEAHYMDFMCVKVTAIQGGNKSEAVPSNSFSFNDFKAVDTKCVLDFPPVDVNENENGASVRFPNPFYFYEKLKRSVKPHAANGPTFTFSTKFGDFQRESPACTVSRICEVDVTFPEGVERCVTLEGYYRTRKDLTRVMFRETDTICVTEENVVLLAAVPASVIALTIVVVVIIICVVKAWTMSTDDLPKPLIFDKKTQRPDDSKVGEMNILVPKPEICPVPFHKPVKTPNDHSGNFLDSSARSDSSQSVTCSTERKQLYDGRGQDLESENGTDNVSSNDSTNTECIYTDCEDEEEDSPSPYDAPHCIRVDLGDGDMVDGYSMRGMEL
ncbi:uncharacterized protein PAE49_019550 isoform 2-T2 [Odontesthes bonariensis]|uniref:uncharacterized protein LOC142366159 isoform X2 n=1 Tax=Odontesthes bonariensis TaxID=219752 RepID=UPI003F584DD9